MSNVPENMIADLWQLAERATRALERIADALESAAESAARARAIDLWAKGQGQHPDD